MDAIVENSDKCVHSTYPLTFEELGQVWKTLNGWELFNKEVMFVFFKGHCFILYSITLKNTSLYGKVLNISKIGDRAYVQIGTVSWLMLI